MKGFKNISEYSDTWTVIQTELNGKPVSIRYRDGLKEAAGHPGYPYRLDIMVSLIDPTQDGLTTNEEAEKLWQLEDSLIRLLEAGNKAIEVLTITTNGMRIFTFQVSRSNSTYFEEKIESHNVQPYKVKLILKEDPKWETFQQILPS